MLPRPQASTTEHCRSSFKTQTLLPKLNLKEICHHHVFINCRPETFVDIPACRTPRRAALPPRHALVAVAVARACRHRSRAVHRAKGNHEQSNQRGASCHSAEDNRQRDTVSAGGGG
eukprot:Selendium_serpulae@DN2197_c0_g1_i1.p1